MTLSAQATASARPKPATAKGLRTRAALVQAARTIFERDGFLDAKLADITREARCAIGSFYTYFSSKDEIFAAVLEEAQHDMMHPGMDHVIDSDDPYDVLEASMRAYLESYKRNAKLMRLLEQVAHLDPAFRSLRARRAEAFVERNAAGIADLQRRDLADPALDPTITAWALSGMVSRAALHVFALGESHLPGNVGTDLDALASTLTRLWSNALNLRKPPGLEPSSPNAPR